MDLDHDQAESIRGLIEDAVSHLCEQEVLSGELVWSFVAALAEVKRLEYQGILSYDPLEIDDLQEGTGEFTFP